MCPPTEPNRLVGANAIVLGTAHRNTSLARDGCGTAYPDYKKQLQTAFRTPDVSHQHMQHPTHIRKVRCFSFSPRCIENTGKTIVLSRKFLQQLQSGLVRLSIWSHLHRICAPRRCAPSLAGGQSGLRRIDLCAPYSGFPSICDVPDRLAV